MVPRPDHCVLKSGYSFIHFHRSLTGVWYTLQLTYQQYRLINDSTVILVELGKLVASEWLPLFWFYNAWLWWWSLSGDHNSGVPRCEQKNRTGVNHPDYFISFILSSHHTQHHLSTFYTWQDHNKPDMPHWFSRQNPLLSSIASNCVFWEVPNIGSVSTGIPKHSPFTSALPYHIFVFL